MLRITLFYTLLFLLPLKTRSMCFDPTYMSTRYHQKLTGTAPYIMVGEVIETRQNKTHQNVKFVVLCVYKGPREQKETLLKQEITFTMQHRKICEPLLRQHKQYLFFLDEKAPNNKSRRRKKKKNGGKDFTRMRAPRKHKTKYISLGAPIPIDAMDSTIIDRLVEQVKSYGPVGHCYNVWSPWSSCSTKCSVGTMTRTFPRHRKPNLNQQAVCHNAPCSSSLPAEEGAIASQPKFQYQPVSVDYCKSMELIRVRWCTGHCAHDTHISTAISWEVNPVLMLCEEPTLGEETLQYKNVAIPHDCGCVNREAVDQKYAVISNSGSPNSQQSTRKRRQNRAPPP